MRSNYYKLFKESFADKNFKDKWKQFEEIRNKIAHNNLFTAEDLEAGEQLARELTDIISAADTEASKLVITTQEREAIQEKVIARVALSSELTKETFLSELDTQEQAYARRAQGFVGLTRFVSHLGTKGYSYASSRSMIDQLSQS